MTMLADISPDIDEMAIYGFCRRCECEVLVVRRDAGFGYEYGSIQGFHHDWQSTCCECGDEL